MEAATSIVQILKTHGYYGQATLLAHSYGKFFPQAHCRPHPGTAGTFIVTVLLRRCPGAVAACVFVDPVNFLIFLPNTSQVLIHKTPSTWTTWAAQKLVAHELCTAVTLCRRTLTKPSPNPHRKPNPTQNSVQYVFNLSHPNCNGSKGLFLAAASI